MSDLCVQQRIVVVIIPTSYIALIISRSESTLQKREISLVLELGGMTRKGDVVCLL